MINNVSVFCLLHHNGFLCIFLFHSIHYCCTHVSAATMGFLPDTSNRELRMRRICRERFSRHRLQMKPVVSDPGMHHGTCVTHVPWCMSESLTRGGGENVPGIPGACATRNFTNPARGPSSNTHGRKKWRRWTPVWPPIFCLPKFAPTYQIIRISGNTFGIFCWSMDNNAMFSWNTF